MANATFEEIMSRPICPIVWINNANDLEYVHCDPACAWWDADRNQCAMLTIAKAIHKEANKK